MAIKISPRIIKLRNAVLQSKPRICCERALIYTLSHKETEGMPEIIRKAKALEKLLNEMTLWIADGELIIGNQGRYRRSGSLYPETANSWLEKEIDSFPTRDCDKLVFEEPEKGVLYNDVFPYWHGKTIFEHSSSFLKESITPFWNTIEDFLASDCQVFSPDLYLKYGIGHFTVDYQAVIQHGLYYFIQKLENCINNLDMSDPESIEKSHFYKASLIVCNAVINFAKRYSELANGLAKNEKDKKRCFELKQISHICNNIPAKPAVNFWEAVQSFWFIHLIVTLEIGPLSITPGRFDQTLGEFYEKDIKTKTVTKQFAQEIIDALWIKFGEIVNVFESGFVLYSAGFAVGQTLCLGGQTPEGKDATNELSYACLVAEEHIKFPTPSVGVRLHRRTPDHFLIRTCEVIKQGIGKPALFNDEITIDSLLNVGMSLLSDVRDYTHTGCVEPTVVSKEFGWTNACLFNLAKCLELALNSGKCGLCDKQVGPKTTPMEEIYNFEEFWKVFLLQLSTAVKRMVGLLNGIELLHQKLLPTPFSSCLIQDCIEKGRDLTAGGARYNSIGCTGIGLANVANSLIIMKKGVFGNGTILWNDLKEALHNNYKGSEDLRQNLIKNFPKYGNDEDEVDDMARLVGRAFCTELLKYVNRRGGRYLPGLWSVSANVPLGLRVSATPDGRFSKTPLADGVSPTAGTALNGPSAIVKSASKLDYFLVPNGTILNLKFLPKTLEGKETTYKLAKFIKSFFQLGGLEIQFNVVSDETLRKAKAHPDEYRDLVVRVAGYSAFFVDLFPDVQEDIIRRSSIDNI